jgi:hypothetical protein
LASTLAIALTTTALRVALKLAASAATALVVAA